MKPYLAREALSPKISLWRVYASEKVRNARGPYVGAFVLITDGGALIAKGFVLQEPGKLSPAAVRDIAEQIAKETGAGSLVLERHGRWVRVNLYNLQVKNEEKVVGGGACGSECACVGDCAEPVRLEQPRSESVSG